jgi:predicted extracellular nuclease
MQITPNIAGWSTTDKEKFGGIYIYTNGAQPQPALGDEVVVQAELVLYYDLREMKNIEYMHVEKSGSVPDPVVVKPQDIGTGAPLADAYTSVLVQVANVTVSALELYDEFSVTGTGSIAALRVDDAFYDYTNPTVGMAYSTITGILHYSYDNHKLLPRFATDMVVDD